jgi:hypothetical protein
MIWAVKVPTAATWIRWERKVTQIREEKRKTKIEKVEQIRPAPAPIGDASCAIVRSR